jgi:hypothetical protein
LELATEAGQAETVNDELRDLRQATEAQGQFGVFLTNPSISENERRQVLERVFRSQVSPLMMSFLGVMNVHGRLGLLAQVADFRGEAGHPLRGGIEFQRELPTLAAEAFQLQVGGVDVVGQALRFAAQSGDVLFRLNNAVAHAGGLIGRFHDGGATELLLMLLILFALYGNMKFPLVIVFSVLVTEPVGGLLALKLTGTNFSVSSLLGFVALMGVAVQTSVILYSFINKLRLEGRDIREATLTASLMRLRPIMITALVACLGLLPAAMSTGIGSDSQKPFAIVIVGGLASRLLLSVFLAPVLYSLVARDRDVLQV